MFIITLNFILFFSSCKPEKNEKISDTMLSDFEVKKEIIRLSSKKDTILKDHYEEKEFFIIQNSDGNFLKDQNYTENFTINFGKCETNTPKVKYQTKLMFLKNTFNTGDWDFDGSRDFNFIYKELKDGVDFNIVSVFISNCNTKIFKSTFYVDENNFMEEYEKEVSHIKNIKSPEDYYKRNFEYTLSKSSLKKGIKEFLIQNFEMLLKSNHYKF